MGLVLALVVTSVSIAASFKCIPCPENYYCQKGIDYSCPDSKPITNGTGAKSEADCMTCTERDGESYPYFDNLSGDCKACWQISENTPYWNGSACAACPSGTEWDGTICKEVEPEVACAFTVPHNGGTLCLVENVDTSVYGSSVPQSAEEETEEFKAKYGIVNTATEYPDYWAGAMKYCQDKGLRLPTMDELVSIANATFLSNETCDTVCSQANVTGCCDTPYNPVPYSIPNGLFDFWSESSVFSSQEINGIQVYGRFIIGGQSLYAEFERQFPTLTALCVK